MPDTERRTFTLDRAGLRAAAGGAKFKGHAAVFGERTWIGPPKVGFWEEVARGAFDKALAEDDVRFLLEHDPRWVLGRTAAGTLRLSTDKRGLVVDADLPETSFAADAAVSMERGDLDQMSFAFEVRSDKGAVVGEEWSRLKNGEELRRLTDLRLYDVSLVAYPAYAGTDAALRAVEARRADHIQQRNADHRAWLDAARRELSV